MSIRAMLSYLAAGLIAAPALAAPAEPAAGTRAAAVPAVTFRTTTLDGGRFDLADHREGWVAVNFWATWCKPCRKEIPDLDSLHRARPDVTVVGLAFEETTPEVITAFLADYPASYPMALVDVYEPPEAFGVPRVLPTTVLVRPDGTLGRRFVGPVTAEELTAAIDGEGPP